MVEQQGKVWVIRAYIWIVSVDDGDAYWRCKKCHTKYSVPSVAGQMMLGAIGAAGDNLIPVHSVRLKTKT